MNQPFKMIVNTAYQMQSQLKPCLSVANLSVLAPSMLKNKQYG